MKNENQRWNFILKTLKLYGIVILMESCKLTLE